MGANGHSVKVSPDTYRRVRRAAKREQRTIQAVLDRAVWAYDQAARRASAAKCEGTAS